MLRRTDNMTFMWKDGKDGTFMSVEFVGIEDGFTTMNRKLEMWLK